MPAAEKRNLKWLVCYYRKEIFDLTQPQLADKANIGLRTIQKIEEDENYIPKKNVIEALVVAFEFAKGSQEYIEFKNAAEKKRGFLKTNFLSDKREPISGMVQI